MVLVGRHPSPLRSINEATDFKFFLFSTHAHGTFYRSHQQTSVYPKPHPRPQALRSHSLPTPSNKPITFTTSAPRNLSNRNNLKLASSLVPPPANSFASSCTTTNPLGNLSPNPV